MVEAQQFAKQMAANALIEGEVEKSRASVIKAKAEADEALAKAERAKKGGGEGADGPFKVSGSVDLGKFNYQDLLKQQSDDLKALKTEADEAAANQAAISDDLRERLHAKEMEVMTTSFTAQMQVLTKMVEASASKGSFMEQYAGMQNIAKTLGFSQPQMAGDMSSQMTLKKMEFEQTMELKKMARDEKRADRDFQRQLNADGEERAARKIEQEREAKRDEMFTSAPKVIGSAIAQGILANKGKGGGVTEEAPTEVETPREEQGKHAEAGWGEGGEVECPDCSQPIAIGRTARAAVCANCGTELPIRRIGEKPTVGGK